MFLRLFFLELFSTSQPTMRSPSSKRVGIVLLMLGVGGSIVGLMAWHARSTAGGPGMPTASMPSASPAPIRPQGSARPTPSTVAAVTQSPSGPAPTTTEICGHGLVPVDIEDHEAMTKYNGSLVGAKEAEWIASMQNSSDLRTRAAGLLLDGREYGDNLISSASERARNDLVQLAVGANDPAVYGLAVQMCGIYRSMKGSEACQQISVSRWAQLDPSNAAPWFVMADRAHAAQDEATEAMAFEHASHATQWHRYTDELVAFADAVLPKDLPEYDRMVLQADVVNYGNSLSDYPWGIVVDRCSRAALQDSDRVSTCSSIADLLVDRGRSFMGFVLGIRVGERVGWPAARLDALREEFTAMHSRTLAAGAKSLGCDSTKRREAIMQAAVEGGEMALVRAVVQTSGIPVSELAKDPEVPVETLLDQLEEGTKPAQVVASP